MDDRKRWLAALLLGAGLLGAGVSVGAAGTASEMPNGLFELGVLDVVETGDKLVYSRERVGSITDGESVPEIADGSVEIALSQAESGERAAHVVLVEGGRERRFNPFPGTAGNPLLMVFMETNVHTMAAATGGSPFYIRNRMREALRREQPGEPVTLDLAAGAVAGERYTFKPFAGDPNSSRMGAFSELEISFVLSPAVPGRFARMEVVAGDDAAGAPALRETISFERIEESLQ